jgi:hypothetical protein
MRRSPATNPLDVRRPSEVLAVRRLIEPAMLTRRFARSLTVRLRAVALVVTIARIGPK